MTVRCWFVRRELSALADNELRPRRRRRVERHLAVCESCRAMAEEFASDVRWQRELFRAVRPPLSRPLREHLAATYAAIEEERAARTFPSVSLLLPYRRWALGTLGIALLVALATIGNGAFLHLRHILTALGIAAPPPEVVKATELFRDYPVLENLDWLENWERHSRGDSHRVGSQDGQG